MDAIDAERTFRVDFAYDGTEFLGFAVQPSGRSVQGVVEAALQSILGQPVRVTAAGRTDAGVHAARQTGSFRARSRLSVAELVRACRALLPSDIVVLDLAEAPNGFNARRDAVGRRYRYVIWNKLIPDVWARRWSWHVPDRLDVAAMSETAGAFIGAHDFRAFHGHAAQQPPMVTVRTVSRCQVTAPCGGVIHIDVAADAFLRHMVRGMVGSLVRVGRGRLDRSQIERTLAGWDRIGAGPTAPAAGLTFLGADYLGARAASDVVASAEPAWLDHTDMQCSGDHDE
ncbi:MAG: tRNA pseudouridine(38-40) synthase TruA [Chloroflexota bacterium]